MASISSMKMMDGDFSLACLNRSRTREAPTPTNISTKSDPEREKNGTPASPAIALAKRVLPVPGGPTNKAPLGIFPPKRVYLEGSRRKLTISCNSSLAPSNPATFSKVTWIRSFSSNTRALLLPMLKIWLPPPPAPPAMRRNIQTKNTIMMIKGSHESRSPQSVLGFSIRSGMLSPLASDTSLKVFSKLAASTKRTTNCGPEGVPFP